MAAMAKCNIEKTKTNYKVDCIYMYVIKKFKFKLTKNLIVH